MRRCKQCKADKIGDRCRTCGAYGYTTEHYFESLCVRLSRSERQNLIDYLSAADSPFVHTNGGLIAVPRTAHNAYPGSRFFCEPLISLLERLISAAQHADSPQGDPPVCVEAREWIAVLRAASLPFTHDKHALDMICGLLDVVAMIRTMDDPE